MPTNPPHLNIPLGDNDNVQFLHVTPSVEERKGMQYGPFSFEADGQVYRRIYNITYHTGNIKHDIGLHFNADRCIPDALRC